MAARSPPARRPLRGVSPHKPRGRRPRREGAFPYPPVRADPFEGCLPTSPVGADPVERVLFHTDPRKPTPPRGVSPRRPWKPTLSRGSAAASGTCQTPTLHTWGAAGGQPSVECGVCERFFLAAICAGGGPRGAFLPRTPLVAASILFGPSRWRRVSSRGSFMRKDPTPSGGSRHPGAVAKSPQEGRFGAGYAGGGSGGRRPQSQLRGSGRAPKGGGLTVSSAPQTPTTTQRSPSSA